VAAARRAAAAGSPVGTDSAAAPARTQAAPHPDDVVIVCAVRTPICKAKKGGLKDTPAEDLLSTVLAALLERTKLDPALVGDVVVGSVLGANVWRANQARIAMFLAGYPDSVRPRLPAQRRATTLAALPGAWSARAPAAAPRSRGAAATAPRQVPVRTINRQCSSGLQAVADVASAIKARAPRRARAHVRHRTQRAAAKAPQRRARRVGAEAWPRARRAAADARSRARAGLTSRDAFQPPSAQAGYYDFGVGAGVESMSMDPMKLDDVNINPKVFENSHARGCLVPMGITSENVAAKYGVGRDVQDALAASSHARAAAARASGRFRDEIVPVRTVLKDAASGEAREVTIAEDDGIRPGVTAAQLAQLKPAFRKGGCTTAGNASQVSDGAGAVLVARRSAAARLGLPVLGVWRSFAVVGCDPELMGIGPALAIPKALQAAGLATDDVALYELNEAFASQATYCQRVLGLKPERVNVNGGAIALGHPLGATGARCVATLLHELRKRPAVERYGVISMCIGSGMGAAAVLERGDA
jgi:acetyl-CoA acetyltransferase family protein